MTSKSGYRISLVGDVPSAIRKFASVAASLGKKKAYLEAWLTIESHLTTNPHQFGECRYTLLNGDLQCHIGAMAPVAVEFAVHEKTRTVMVLKAYLLGS
jgi:hypothetical protein